MGDIGGKLIALILAAFTFAKVALIGYDAFVNSRISSAISDMSSLVLNIQHVYGMQNNFSSLNNNIMARLAPPSIVANNSIVNSWGGTITGGVELANPTQFFILNANLPNKACSKFALFASAKKVQINGGTLYGQGNRIDAAQAVEECDSADDNNTIRFVFGH